MTKQELNRDIKRLYKKFLARTKGSTEGWTRQDWIEYEGQQAAIKAELIRLWRADYEKTYTSLESLKMLLIMNQAMRVIPLHTLAHGMKTKLDD